MYLNLSDNVQNGVDSREVAREMLKAHLNKVRGMTVQDKAIIGEDQAGSEEEVEERWHSSCRDGERKLWRLGG